MPVFFEILQVHQLSLKLNQTQTELNDEKQLSMALQMNQVTWQNKFNALEIEFKEYKKEKELVPPFHDNQI